MKRSIVMIIKPQVSMIEIMYHVSLQKYRRRQRVQTLRIEDSFPVYDIGRKCGATISRFIYDILD